MNVGELYAVLRLDDADFQRGVGRAQQSLAATQDVAKRMFTAASAGAVAATGATMGLVGATMKVGLGYNRMQQNTRAALTTLLGSAEAANAQMDKLDEFARTSPFAKSVFITAQQQLLAFGVDAEKVLPTLDAIQQAVAATGGSGQQVGEIAFILAQISAAGKITGQDLMQLGQRGVDAATLMGEQWQMTGAEVREAITKGKIAADDALDAIATGLKTKFDGATAGLKQQMDGAVDRVKAARREIGAALAAPFISQHGGGHAVDWANQLADALQAVRRKAAPVVDILDGRLTPAYELFSTTLRKAKERVDAFHPDQLERALDKIADYGPLVAGTASAVAAFGGPAVLGPLAAFVPKVNPVLAGLLGLVAATPELKTGLADAFEELGPTGAALTDAGKAAADLGMGILDESVPALVDLAHAGVDVLNALAPLVPGTLSVISVFTPLVGTAARLLSSVAGLPTPLLATAAALTVLARTGAVNRIVDGLGKGFGALVERTQGFRQAVSGLAYGLATPGMRMQALASGAVAVGGAVKAAGASLLSAFGGPVGLAIMGVSMAIGAVAARSQAAKQRVEDFKSSLDDQTGALTANTRALAAKRLEEAGMLERGRKLGLSYQEMVDSVLGVGDAQDRVREKLSHFTKEMTVSSYATGDAAKTYTVLTDEAAELSHTLGLERNALEDARAAKEREIEATKTSTDAKREENEATREANDLARKAAGNRISLAEANIRVIDETQRATERIKENNQILNEAGEVIGTYAAGIDSSTEAGRENHKALLDLALAMNDQIDAMDRTGAPTQAVIQKQEELRRTLVEVAKQTGLTQTEAEDLAEAYIALDKLEPHVDVTADASQAKTTLRDIRGMVDNLPSYKQIEVVTSYTAIGGSSIGRGPVAVANADGNIWPGRRQAQIVHGHDSRRVHVWGEDVTHGEAYIPFNPAKRPRSIALLSDVARRFGLSVITQAQPQVFANGGVAGPGPVALTPPMESWPREMRCTLTIAGREVEGIIREIADDLANERATVGGGF